MTKASKTKRDGSVAGAYTHKKCEQAFKTLERDYVGRSKLPLSPSAPVDKAQVRKDTEAMTREPPATPVKFRYGRV
jgi:hypothetical protein